MVEFIIGAAGSGKSSEIIRKTDTLVDSGKEICIIVPEQFSYEFDKNLYKKVGAKKFNMMASHTFTSIARQLFQSYGDRRRNGEYADETARMILVYEAVATARDNPDSSGTLKRQLSHSGFVDELLKLICELKRAGITPQMLINKSVMLDKKLMAKTNDIALIYLEYERLMTEYGFKDNFDDISEASQTANMHGYFKGKTVFIDEFESFSGDQLELIRVIISHAEDVYIALRTDDVNAGEFTLFETANETYRSIANICRDLGKKYSIMKCTGEYRFSNPDIAYLSRNILRNRKNINGENIPEPENIFIFEARDCYSEAEIVCASIKRFMYRDRTLRYRDIAVISNNITDYADVLKAAFERYEIPYFMSIEKSVMHTSIMIFFSSLFDIAARRNYSSEMLFRYMKCGLIGIPLTDIAMIENYCYKWGVDGKVWKEVFSAKDENTEKLETIRKSVIEPLQKLKKNLSGKKTAREICRAVYTHIEECGAEKNVSELMNRLVMENRDYEASELKRLWSCMIDILDSLSDTFGDIEITLPEMRNIVKSLIGRIKYSVPPQTLDNVTAAPSGTARLNSPRIVFVMGANDGDFPATVNTHGIFSGVDKQKLSENGIEISRRLPELIAAERLGVYKSLSAASEKVCITYTLSDLSGQSKYAAPVIDEIKTLFGRDIVVPEHSLNPDYYAVTMKAAFYHYMQDRKLNNSSVASIKKILMDDEEYSRRIEYIYSRSQKKNSHSVSTSIVENLKDFEPMNISHTAFELYNKCHFKYFCKEILKLFVLEKVDMNTLYTGSLIHNCFYRIMSSRSKQEFISMSYEQIEKEIFDSADDFIKSEMGGEFAKTPRFEFGSRKLSESLVRVFVHMQHELMASDFEPGAFELNIGFGGNSAPLMLDFGDGKKLVFGGKIDRADVCMVDGTKYVRIIDYKSSAKDITAEKISCGMNMQMLLYLFAITTKGGKFEGFRPAGVLYSPVRISDIKPEFKREESENTKVIDSNLKTHGLVVSDKKVLDAMEHGITGNFIPAKTNKDGNIDKKSHCIPPEAFDELREFSFRKLIQMAESVYSGDADANPLVDKDDDCPCANCDYSDICGNYPMTQYHESKNEDKSEAEKILNEEDEENG